MARMEKTAAPAGNQAGAAEKKKEESVVSENPQEVSSQASETADAETEKTEAAAEKNGDSGKGKKKDFGDDDTVRIKCAALAGKSVVGLEAGKPVTFNEDGTAEVIGKTARYYLSIPGYELVK